MEIIIGSANPHKLEEIEKICADMPEVKFLPFNKPDNFQDIEENGNTLLENARIKAHAFYQITQKPVIADDTGLEVEALNGAPGVYSSRYAGPECSYENNCRKLLQELSGVPREKRRAVFKTVAVFFDGNDEYVAEGICEGYITESFSGENGFGYDPLFYVKEYNQTYAEMPSELKNLISHRGNALKKLKKIIKSYIWEKKRDK